MQLEKYCQQVLVEKGMDNIVPGNSAYEGHEITEK